jgi:hypothetical protein
MSTDHSCSVRPQVGLGVSTYKDKHFDMIALLQSVLKQEAILIELRGAIVFSLLCSILETWKVEDGC